MKKFHWLIQLATGIVLALLGVTLAFGTERGIALQKLEQHEHKFAAVHGRLDSLTSETMQGNRELHRFREQVLADLAVLKALMARIEQRRLSGEDHPHRPPTSTSAAGGKFPAEQSSGPRFSDAPTVTDLDARYSGPTSPNCGESH